VAQLYQNSTIGNREIYVASGEILHGKSPFRHRFSGFYNT